MNIVISVCDHLGLEEVVSLYQANQWSSSEKPDQLLPALHNSHSLVTARVDGVLVGLANAISDGYLVVYFPHMLVHPDFQRRGIGRKIMRKIQACYEGFHQQLLIADEEAIGFYEALGFEKAGYTESMWIYAGIKH